jgi:hypothetical protein
LASRTTDRREARRAIFRSSDALFENGAVRLGDTAIGTLGNDGIGTRALRINFNSNATVEIVQRLLRSIQFRTIDSTNTEQRVITITVNDGDAQLGTSLPVQRIVNVSL